MTMTIEEAAKQAIIDNDYFMADPNHPDFVDRGLEQMRACKWVINHIFSLPLAQRLTAEEKEQIKKLYCAAEASKSDYSRGYSDAIKRIFGADFFKEEE
jgi:hypothetical protein